MNKNLRTKSVLLFSALLIALLIVGAFTSWHLRGVKTAQQTNGIVPSVKQTEPSEKKKTKNESNSSYDKTSSAQNGSSPAITTQKNPSNGFTAVGTLAAPSGSFVSNHRPGANGSPTIEQSQCISTPGAICFIQFTRDGIKKKLDPMTIGDSGSVTWDWDIKGSTLGSGSWQVSAVAQLNGEIKTTVDHNGNLEVN
jgi:hypothetical protein